MCGGHKEHMIYMYIYTPHINQLVLTVRLPVNIDKSSNCVQLRNSPLGPRSGRMSRTLSECVEGTGSI